MLVKHLAYLDMRHHNRSFVDGQLAHVQAYKLTNRLSNIHEYHMAAMHSNSCLLIIVLSDLVLCTFSLQPLP